MNVLPVNIQKVITNFGLRIIKMVKKKMNSVWFRKRNSVKDDWGFIPVNWKGWVALLLLIIANVFSANYFDIMNSSLEDVGKALLVFLFSLVVFVLIAKKKTRGISKNGS